MMAAIARVESRFNSYAIGIVGGDLKRQPTTRKDAVAVADAPAAGWRFSVEVTQINQANLRDFAISHEQAFDVCTNLQISSTCELAHKFATTQICANFLENYRL